MTEVVYRCASCGVYADPDPRLAQQRGFTFTRQGALCRTCFLVRRIEQLNEDIAHAHYRTRRSPS